MDFHPIDLTSPLDTGIRLTQMPVEWDVKGIFFLAANEKLRQAHVQSDLIRDYKALSTYSSRDLIKLLDLYGQTISPELSPRATIFELGRGFFTTLKKLPLGKAIFTPSPDFFNMIIRRTQRIYNLLSTTTANIIETTDHSTIVRLENAWVFPTCYHAGACFGAFEFLEQPNVKISICEHSICNVDIKCEW